MKDIPINSWTERRSFSKFEAELDYLLNCDKDGNLDISIRKLSDRWGWSYVKTFRYSKELKRNKDTTVSVTKMERLSA